MSWRPEDPATRRRERGFSLALFLASLLCASWFVDVWTTPNPVSRALPALTLLERGTLRINTYASMTQDRAQVGDAVYSDKAPLPSLALVPVHAAARTVRVGAAARRNLRRWPIHAWRSLGIEDGRGVMFLRIVPLLTTGSLVFGSLPFALCVLLAYRGLRAAGAGAGAVPLALLPLFGSFAFVYAGTFFGHVLAGFLLLASVLALRDSRPLLSGLALGAAFLTEYTLAVALPVWLLHVVVNERRWRHVPLLLLGFAPAAVFLLAYDQALTGSPWTTLNAYHVATPFQELGHAYGFGWPSPAALWGLTFAPATGLFVFAPALLAVFVVGIRELVRRGPRALLDPVALLAVLFVLLMAGFFTWWGGWTYGPRYLLPVALVLLVEGTAFLVRRGARPWIAGALAVPGLLAAWGAKATLVYLFPDSTSATSPGPPADGGPLLGGILAELRGGRFDANQLGSIHLGLSPGTGSLLFGPVFAALLLGLWAWRRKLDLRAPAEPDYNPAGGRPVD